MSTDTNNALGLAILVIAAALALYFAPTIVAYHRRKIDPAGVLVLNVFLGWTYVGWVVALAWAVIGPTKSAADNPASKHLDPPENDVARPGFIARG